MNKKIASLFFGLFAAINIQAQNVAAIEGQSLMFKKSDETKDFTAGSQYFNERFENANVNDGTTSFSIRYNNYKDIMEYKKTSTEILELIPDKNEKIQFTNGHLYLWKEYTDSKKQRQKGYLKQIASKDNVAFYSSERVKYRPAEKAKNSYETDKAAEFIKEKSKYFIEHHGKIEAVSKAKDIQKIFAKNESELKDFFKNNKIDFEQEEEVKKMIDFLSKLK